MSRRRPFSQQGKSGVTWPIYSEATTNLSGLTLPYMRVMEGFTVTFYDTVLKTFDGEAIRCVENAFPHLDADNVMRHMSYELVPGIELFLGQWTENHLIPLNRKALMHQSNFVIDLKEKVRKLNLLRIEVACVQKVIEWFHTNSTPAATRYYFPALMALAPVEANRLGELPKRWQEPKDVNAIMPLLREAGNTVARLKMVPDNPEEFHSGVALIFDKVENFPYGHLSGYAFELTLPSIRMNIGACQPRVVQS